MCLLSLKYDTMLVRLRKGHLKRETVNDCPEQINLESIILKLGYTRQYNN